MIPSWKDAPDWANWLAQDSDGEWFWFEDKPTPANFCWHTADGSNYQSAGNYFGLPQFGQKESEFWKYQIQGRSE